LRPDAPPPKKTRQCQFDLVSPSLGTDSGFGGWAWRANGGRATASGPRSVKQGFVSYLIAAAREKGVSAYVGDGNNRWAAVHRLDAARLYRLAFENAASGKNGAVPRYHAVGEEGVPMKEIAEAIGRGLRVPVIAVRPEEAVQHFGFLGNFAALDMPASSALTQERLGWHPTRPGLIADLEAMRFDA